MNALFGDNLIGSMPFLAFFVFGFGAIIGSFLNALLWRLRTGESVADGRSYCPCCHHTLAARDLVPIVSFLLLRGKCRYCRKGIHPSYVMVETACGLLFLLMAGATLHGDTVQPSEFARLLLSWYACAILVVTFVFDWRYMLIPRSVVLPGVLIAAAAQLALGAAPFTVALGILIGGGFFWLQYAVSRGRWIGGGDIVLGAFMGALLGWKLVLIALLLAYVSGALVGALLMARKRVGWNGQIPFGTFLSVAAVVTMVWGDRLLAWYLGLIF